MFGVGVGLGGGYSSVAGSETRAAAGSLSGPVLLLPTLELQMFFSGGGSLDLTIPIVNDAILSSELDGFVFSADAFLNANGETRARTTRFVAGTGLGFAVGRLRHQNLGSLRIPLELGFELLNEGYGYGTKFLLRPWGELAFTGDDMTLGGGVLGVLCFSLYSTQGTKSRAP